MSAHGPIHLIEKANKRFDLEARVERNAISLRRPRVIAISRQLGSGGRRIAEALAEQLGCRLWDREILDVMVDQARPGHSARMLDVVDEKAQSAIDAFAFTLVGDISSYLYMHLLPRALAIIARQDAVILGRGAHLALPESLKIRVVASMDTRLGNLVKYEGVSREVAGIRIRKSDQERSAFLRDFARQLLVKIPENGGVSQHDLVLNTDHISIEDAVRVIRILADLRFGKAATKKQLTPAPKTALAAE